MTQMRNLLCTNRKSAILILLACFIQYTCTKNFESINTNPTLLTELDGNSVGSAYARSQYAGVLGNSGNYQIMQSLFADLYAQYFANVATYFPSDRNVLVGNWLNGGWSYYYRNAVTPLFIVFREMDKHSGEYALAQIWKVYVFHRMTDQWGPIPYSEAGNGKESVSYDSQRSIYDDFFHTLDSACTVLDGFRGENIFGVHDQIYTGDVNSWIIFANTLRLRLALRISKVDPNRAKEEAEKAVASGVMESLEHAALLQVTSDSPNNLSGITSWNEFRMSSSMESLLKGYDDPRMPHYFSPIEGTQDSFKGLRNGLSAAELALEENSPISNSNVHPRWLDAESFNTPIYVILAAEAFFLRAEGALYGWEMNGTAREHYEEGIRTSMGQYGISEEEIIDYLANENVPTALPDFLRTPPLTDIPVRFDKTDHTRAMEQILTQKWLAIFPDGIEAWSEVRRSGFPRVYPRVHSENPDIAPGITLRRLTYVVSEYNRNTTALQQGISLLGGADNGAARLWWDVE